MQIQTLFSLVDSMAEHGFHVSKHRVILTYCTQCILYIERSIFYTKQSELRRMLFRVSGELTLKKH